MERKTAVRRYRYDDKEYVFFLDTYKKGVGFFVAVYDKEGKLTAQGVFPVDSERSRPWLFFEQILIAAEIPVVNGTITRATLVNKKNQAVANLEKK